MQLPEWFQWEPITCKSFAVGIEASSRSTSSEIILGRVRSGAAREELWKRTTKRTGSGRQWGEGLEGCAGGEDRWDGCTAAAAA